MSPSYPGQSDIMLGTVKTGWDDTMDSDRFKKGQICEFAIRDGCNIPGCPHREIHEEIDGCREKYCKVINRAVSCKDVAMPKNREMLMRFDYDKYSENMANLRAMDPLSFQQLITGIMGRCNDVLTSDGGIDGFTDSGIPIQVKRMTRVDKNVVTLFASALKAAGRGEGIIVALSFRDSAYQQSLWVKRYEGVMVELLPLEKLMKMSIEERQSFCEGNGWQSEHY